MQRGDGGEEEVGQQRSTVDSSAAVVFGSIAVHLLASSWEVRSGFHYV